jgi:hypothetical protein
MGSTKINVIRRNTVDSDNKMDVETYSEGDIPYPKHEDIDRVVGVDIEDRRLRDIIQTEGRNFFAKSHPIIEINETPDTEDWLFARTFKYDISGEVRIWQMGFDGKYLRWAHGLEKSEEPLYSRSEIIPKVNRNVQEQALLEARSKYSKKYQSGYRPFSSGETRDIEPELGHPYMNDKGEVTHPIRSWPVGVMAKLDGHRMRAKVISNKIVKTSRQHHDLSQMHHLDKELQMYLKFLPKGAFVEGELYRHGYQRSALQSMISTYKNGPHPLAHIVNFYIFDIYWDDNPPFEERYHTLLDAYKKILATGYKPEKVLVLSVTLAYSIDEVNKYHDYYIASGYEGLIAHKMAGSGATQKVIEESRYRPGRTNSIIKFKNFYDEEGTIIDIESGKGEHEGCAIFVIKDKHGKVFNVTPANCTLEERRDWYRNPKKVLGRVYTYYYLSKSEYDIYQHAHGSGFRDPII